MSGTTGEPLSALPVLAYAATAELYAVDPAQPPGLRSGRINVTALVNAATAAALAAAPPAAAGLPAPAAGNTVTTLTPTALLPVVDGAATEYITPANLVTALGNRATDAGVAVASAVAAGDRLFVDQGGSAAVAVTMATLLAYMQANLAAIYPTITVTPPTGLASGAGYTLAGALAHYAAAPALTVAVDGAAAGALPAGSVVTKTAFSLPMPSLPAGTHSVVVADGHGNQSAAAAIAIPPPPEVLTLAGPTASVYAGSAFTLAGTFANATPSALDVSLDGGATFAAATGAAINASGTFSLPLTIGQANPSQAVTVRDSANHAASATTAAFVVNPAVAPSLTLDAISGWTDAAEETIGGSYAGTAPTGVNPAFDGGAYGAATANFTASGGRWSATVTAPAAGSHTLVVQEANAPAIVSPSASFTVGAAVVPVAQVQFAQASSTTNNVAATVTLPAAPTPGNTIILMVQYQHGPLTVPTGYTLFSTEAAPHNDYTMAAYSKTVASGDPATISVTNSVSPTAAQAIEFSGAATFESISTPGNPFASLPIAAGKPTALRYVFLNDNNGNGPFSSPTAGVANLADIFSGAAFTVAAGVTGNIAVNAASGNRFDVSLLNVYGA